jgi:hypothetical protein
MKTNQLMLAIFIFGFYFLGVRAKNNVDQPPHYKCFRVKHPITVDGNINPAEWGQAIWSRAFVDIRGEYYKKQPNQETHVMMLWDDDNLYIAAELKEEHIWATVKGRDETIYWDNDFEFFIDPEGDSRDYFEFEMNAYGTEWDLLLTKPYFQGGTYLVGFDIKGLETAVNIYGTLNDPSDKDDKWTIEIKVPFKALNKNVKAGDIWRMNFSRVEWQQVEVLNGKYVKKKGKEGMGNEDNWVWAPTGLVDIHRPSKWGFVTFLEE